MLSCRHFVMSSRSYFVMSIGLIVNESPCKTYLAVSPSFRVRFFMTLLIFGRPQVLPAGKHESFIRREIFR